MPTPDEVRAELDQLSTKLAALNEPTLDDEFKNQLRNFEQQRAQLENDSQKVDGPLAILRIQLAIANLQKDLAVYEIKKAEREVGKRAIQLSEPVYAPLNAIMAEKDRIYARVARRHRIENTPANAAVIEGRMRFYEGMQVKRLAKQATALAARIESSAEMQAIHKQRNVELRNVENAFSSQRAASEQFDNLANTLSEQIMSETRRAQAQALEDPSRVIELAHDLFSKWKNIHALPLQRQEEFFHKVTGLSQAVQNIHDEAALSALSRIFNESKTAIETEIRYQAYLVEEDVDANFNPKSFEEILASSNPAIKPYSALWKIVDNTRFAAQSDIQLTAVSSSTTESLSTSPSLEDTSSLRRSSESSSSSAAVEPPAEPVGEPVAQATTAPETAPTATAAATSRARVITPLQEIGRHSDSETTVKNLKAKFERMIEENKAEAEKSTTRPPRKN